MTDLKIYGFLRLGEDLLDTEAQLGIFDFLENIVDTEYDWDTSKLKLKISMNSLDPLLALEDYLLDNIQGKFTASLEISADIKNNKYVEQEMTYKLFYSPELNDEVKQMVLKLFPAKHLIS